MSSSAANSRSISARAAICRRRARSSENSRAFSSASAAWSANVCSSAPSSSVKRRPRSVGDAEGADHQALHAQRHREQRPLGGEPRSASRRSSDTVHVPDR